MPRNARIVSSAESSVKLLQSMREEARRLRNENEFDVFLSHLKESGDLSALFFSSSPLSSMRTHERAWATMPMFVQCMGSCSVVYPVEDGDAGFAPQTQQEQQQEQQKRQDVSQRALRWAFKLCTPPCEQLRDEATKPQGGVLNVSSMTTASITETPKRNERVIQVSDSPPHSHVRTTFTTRNDAVYAAVQTHFVNLFLIAKRACSNADRGSCGVFIDANASRDLHSKCDTHESLTATTTRKPSLVCPEYDEVDADAFFPAQVAKQTTTAQCKNDIFDEALCVQFMRAAKALSARAAASTAATRIAAELSDISLAAIEAFADEVFSSERCSAECSAERLAKCSDSIPETAVAVQKTDKKRRRSVSRNSLTTHDSAVAINSAIATNAITAPNATNQPTGRKYNKRKNSRDVAAQTRTYSITTRRQSSLRKPSTLCISSSAIQPNCVHRIRVSPKQANVIPPLLDSCKTPASLRRQCHANGSAFKDIKRTKPIDQLRAIRTAALPSTCALNESSDATDCARTLAMSSHIDPIMACNQTDRHEQEEGAFKAVEAENTTKSVQSIDAKQGGKNAKEKFAQETENVCAVCLSTLPMTSCSGALVCSDCNACVELLARFHTHAIAVDLLNTAFYDPCQSEQQDAQSQSLQTEPKQPYMMQQPESDASASKDTTTATEPAPVPQSFCDTQDSIAFADMESLPCDKIDYCEMARQSRVRMRNILESELVAATSTARSLALDCRECFPLRDILMSNDDEEFHL